MRHLTVRNVPDDLGRALDREKRRRGTSLNQTILDLLRDALGVETGRARSNGLAKLAGSWSEEYRKRFEDSLAVAEQVDEDLWR